MLKHEYNIRWKQLCCYSLIRDDWGPCHGNVAKWNYGWGECRFGSFVSSGCCSNGACYGSTSSVAAVNDDTAQVLTLVIINCTDEVVRNSGRLGVIFVAVKPTRPRYEESHITKILIYYKTDLSTIVRSISGETVNKNMLTHLVQWIDKKCSSRISRTNISYALYVNREKSMNNYNYF